MATQTDILTDIGSQAEPQSQAALASQKVVGVSAAFHDQSGTFLPTNAATALVNGQQAQHVHFFCT